VGETCSYKAKDKIAQPNADAQENPDQRPEIGPKRRIVSSFF
jgi:hypothetical protein